MATVQSATEIRPFHHVPRRDLANSAQLGRGELPERQLLQRARQGGHFAAWEEPELFSEELRAAFASVR